MTTAPDLEQVEALREATQMLKNAEKRDGRTPLTEAIKIVFISLPRNLVSDKHEDLVAGLAQSLFDRIFIPFLKLNFSEKDLDEVAAEARRSKGLVNLPEKVVAYCALAAKAFACGESNVAWSFIADAMYWNGIVSMARGRSAKVSHGALLARMRHKKTHEERERIADYWRANVPVELSAQKAADKILAADITKWSHKTIAEIVSPLRKAELVRKK